MDLKKIMSDALIIRNNLGSSQIDYAHYPIPPFIGNGQIKLIIIGQDPTIEDESERDKITCTLNLDKKGPLKNYVNKICKGLGITLDNVYATNLFKYFFKDPPAVVYNVLVQQLMLNLQLLQDEISDYKDCPIITLGEPVLQLLSNDNNKVRICWDYDDYVINNKCNGCNGCTKCKNFNMVLPDDNKLGRLIFPFPHIRSLGKNLYKNNLDNYIDYVKKTAKL